jgi:hypothetical protein
MFHGLARGQIAHDTRDRCHKSIRIYLSGVILVATALGKVT